MIYLDEIKWDDWVVSENAQYFHPEMRFDRRSLPDQGVPGLTAGRFVVCEGAVVPAGAIALGEPGHILTPGERAGLGTVVGEPVPAITVAEAVEKQSRGWQ